MNMSTQMVVGSRIYSILYGGRHGVIYAIHGEQGLGNVRQFLGGAIVTGGVCYFDVVFENGTLSKRIPETIVKGVQWRLVEGVATDDEIQTLLANAEETARLADIERTEKAAAYTRAVETLRADADKAYLQQGDDDASGKLVAVNLRKEFKKAFPGIKFSVRKPDYGVVNVSWVDGPTNDAVNAIVRQYQAGSFNGMEDIYEYDVQPFHKVFGGARYIFTDRDFSDEHIQKAINTLFVKYSGNFKGMPCPMVGQFRTGELCRSYLPGFNDDLQMMVRQEAARS